MKKIAVYLILFLFATTSFACNPEDGKTKNTKNENSVDKIQVYYFHFARRCATCNAVEEVTKEALQKYFAEDVKNGKIVFTSINLDEESSKTLAKKLKISGQTLLFVAGDKQKNLTNVAFMYAKSSPKKLKVKVKKAIEELKK